jgi:hypothetical protein
VRNNEITPDADFGGNPAINGPQNTKMGNYEASGFFATGLRSDIGVSKWYEFMISQEGGNNNRLYLLAYQVSGDFLPNRGDPKFATYEQFEDTFNRVSASFTIKPSSGGGSNTPPIADAGDDRTVRPGVTVTLGGTGSRDPDGGRITYSWTLESASPLIAGGTVPPITMRPNLQVPNPTFTAPIGLILYTFKLVVTDERGLQSEPDFVTIRVDFTVPPPPNRPPIADAGDPQTVQPGSPVTLTAVGSSDPDGDPITYSWILAGSPPSSPVIGLPNDPQNPVRTFTAPQTPGDYTFELVVTDNKGAASTPDRVFIRVVPNNVPPIANAGRDATAKPGDTVTLDGSASNDPDAFLALSLKYQWTQIGSTASTYPITLSSADTANPKFTVPASINARTTLSFQLTVSDERGGISLPDTVDITIDPSMVVARSNTTTTSSGDGGGIGDSAGGPAEQAGSELQQGEQAAATTQSTSPAAAAAATAASQCVGEQGATATQPQSQTEFIQYENATHGIRIMYPANWTISEFDTKPVAVFSAANATAAAAPLTQQQDNVTRSPATVILNVNTSLPVQNMTQDFFSIDYVTDLMNSPTHYDLILNNVSGFNNTTSTMYGTNQQEPVAGEVQGGLQRNSSLAFDTVEYSGTSFVDGCDIKGIDLWTVINGKLYSITYLAVEPLYSVYLPLAQQMVNSFEIIAGGDTSTTTTASSSNIYDYAPDSLTSDSDATAG